MEPGTDRRNFLKTTLAAGSVLAVAGENRPAGAAASPRAEPKEIHAPPIDKLRIGLVGLGDRGTYLLSLLLGIPKIQVRAVCDLDQAKAARAQRLVEDYRLPRPESYCRGETDYRRLCGRDDLDLVVNATPWPLHSPVVLAALEAGKHAATEVPAALSVEECWRQVEAAEKANRHCVLLENYCYQRDVMLVLNLVRKGLFGQVMHAEGGYQKDGREYEVKSADGQLNWQGEIRKSRKGNPFPTHDVGPLAQWMDIHRGDRFEYLVSMGGNARGYHEYAARYLPAGNSLAMAKFDMADVNSCLIRTAKGRTIYLLSDTLLSRPQSRNLYRLLGSQGIYDRTIDRLYLEDRSPKRDRCHGEWELIVSYYSEFDHPLWKAFRNKTISTGKGGGDYLCLYRLVQALRTGTRPDIDVYDSAAWSSIVELSETSARNRSQPLDFPDFTRGRWKTTPPEPLVEK
jgi:hypothetical protein